MVAYEKTVCNDNFNLHVVSFWLWRFGRNEIGHEKITHNGRKFLHRAGL